MKKILIIFTGGTIGSSAVLGTINTNDNSCFVLLQLFNQHYPQAHDIEFDTVQPLQILSENLSSHAWQVLINAIETKNPANYDGIIVTHGTDTLAYTACALSFYFNAINIPLLLVSSNYPLEYPESNGLENFIYAVNYISQQHSAGVFVPYRNKGQGIVLHQGSQLACSLQLSSDFISVSNNIIKKSKLSPMALKPLFSEQVLMIKPYPNLNYNQFNLTGVVAVIHDLYHSGTACVEPFNYENAAYSLLEFIKRCNSLNIAVYLAPIIKSSATYQSTQLLIEQGAHIIWNTSIEASYVKLLLAYANFNTLEAILDFMQRNIADEHIN